MIRFQTFLYSRFLVIIPLVEGSAAFVTDIFLFGGIEGDMEGCATGLADAAARYAADKVGVGNSNVHSGVKLDLEVLQDVIKSSSLFLRAWESIQDESFDTVRLAQAFPYDSNGTSSGTSPPASIYFLASLPSSVPFFTAARNISPVEIWGIGKSATNFSAWVPCLRREVPLKEYAYFLSYFMKPW